MVYTNHDFLPYKDTKDVLIYESYADLFHITNISLYRDIINLETVTNPPTSIITFFIIALREIP